MIKIQTKKHNMASEILDRYEIDLNFNRLKNSIRKASDEVLWGQHGMFSCLTDGDNALPQLLRMNYKRRFELLVIMTSIKLNKESDLLESSDEEDEENHIE